MTDVAFAVLAGLASGPVGAWLGFRYLAWRDRQESKP